ncbi:MAG: efflux RND transporter permease subunit [Eubacteriales bacterium]
MQLTKLALQRPVATLLLLFTIVLFGISSLFGFQMAYTPSIEMPTYIVYTIYAGATPEIVDTTVSDPIEAIGQTVTGFSESTVFSMEDMSMVVFQFDYDVDADQTYTDLGTALDRVTLPDDAMEPTMFQIDLDALPIMTLSIASATGADILSYANDTVVPQLESLSGVTEVEVYGGVEDYIQIQADPSLLNQYGLSLSSISTALSIHDFDMPIGSIPIGTQDISVSATSAPDSLDDLQNTIITTSTGNLLVVGDVASVSIGSKAADTVSRYNGADNITITITSGQDANIPTVASDVEAVLDTLNANNPNVNIDVIDSSSDDIITSLKSVGSTLILSVFLCMVVLYVFLGNMKASLIVGSSIPISLVITLILMNLAGFELNVITTGALVIAIGMMVDNSIVVLESIFKSQKEGLDFRQVAFTGCKLVGSSVAASTVTTIVVYLPLALLDGVSGQMFSQMGLTIVFAMVASLFAAIVLVPLFYYLWKPTEKKAPIHKLITKIENGYGVAARNALRHKKTVLFISLASLALSIYLGATLPFVLFPSSDDGSFTIAMEFRPNSQLDAMDAEASVVEEMLANDDRVEDYTLTISGTEATLTAYLKDGMITDDVISDYEVKTSTLSNTSITIEAQSSMNMGGASSSDMFGSSNTVETTLSGYDYDAMQALVTQLETEIYQLDGVIKVENSLGSIGATKAEVVVNPQKALYYGTTAVEIASTLRYAVTGIEVTTIDLNNTEYDIYVEYPEGTYDDFVAFMDMPISTPKGDITLGEIASLEFSETAQSIQKTNGIYCIDITATVYPSAQASVQAAITEMEGRTYGDDINLGEDVGSDMVSEELFAIVGALVTAVFLVFVVMAMQFESLRFSVMVMTSMVFGMVGSFVLLFVSGSDLTSVALMGFLMLVGIVVNNGILFVDTTNQLRATMSVEDALVQAGRLRMRPILMTTMTTILAMVPMALGIGEGAEMRQAMGIVIIGGLVTSTLLVLFLMPTFYMFIHNKKEDQKEPLAELV